MKSVSTALPKKCLPNAADRTPNQSICSCHHVDGGRDGRLTVTLPCDMQPRRPDHAPTTTGMWNWCHHGSFRWLFCVAIRTLRNLTFACDSGNDGSTAKSTSAKLMQPPGSMQQKLKGASGEKGPQIIFGCKHAQAGSASRMIINPRVKRRPYLSTADCLNSLFSED
jgi:hypothetical protein